MLEDDITFSSSLPQLGSVILSLLDEPAWDFVYFGHEGTDGIPRASSNTSTEEFKFDPWKAEIQTTHFYGVGERILPRLIAHLESLSNGAEGDQEAGPMPLDGAYNIFRKNNPDAKCLVACPKLGWQRPSRSDIMPKAFDSFLPLRNVTSFLRDLKHFTNVWRS